MTANVKDYKQVGDPSMTSSGMMFDILRLHLPA
ncbi:hypothetical protein ACVWZX_005024 [Deinococcus sp. UYEF24]